MREELDKLLCEQYPYMFRERNMPMTHTCMCWGFSHGDGWFNIIKSLCSGIQHHVNWKREQRARALLFNRKLKRAIAANDVNILIDPEYANKDWHVNECNQKLASQEFREVPEYVQRVVVEQVKEKFGTLRFYYRGGDDVVDGMVRMAEAMSAVTCEECGSPGSTGGYGWISSLCTQHREEVDARRKARFGED